MFVLDEKYILVVRYVFFLYVWYIYIYVLKIVFICFEDIFMYAYF